MIRAYKNRTVDFSKRVRVYRNLHKKCFSMKQGGKVVGHFTNMALVNCYFIVSKAGSQRAKRTQQRNVHAFVEGYIEENYDNHLQDEYKLMYDPFKDEEFKVRSGDAEHAVYFASAVKFTNVGAYAIKPQIRWGSGHIQLGGSR